MEPPKALLENFDAQWYLETYPDVARAGIDPLAHFVEHGDREGRSLNAWFKPDEYLAMNPDVARARSGAATHFFTAGLHEGRVPGRGMQLPATYRRSETSVEARISMIRAAVEEARLYAGAPSLDALLWFGVMSAAALHLGGEVDS